MRKVQFFVKELMATFWFVPVLIIGLAILLSIGLVYLDSILDLPKDGWVDFFLVDSADSARGILSTISGAMIGVAGTVFSVTLVALTLASSQFGSRLIKNFMYVRLNQVVLGSYISTYLYCLLILNSVKDTEGHAFIPSISIFVAILVAISNIVLLIVFIHQIAISIQADKVVSDISEFISRQVETLFPEELMEEEKKSIEPMLAISCFQKQIPLRAPKSGYLQYIDSQAMVQLAAHHNVLVELNYRPGGYLVKDRRIGTVYSNIDWDSSKFGEVFRQLVIGQTKTSQQDIEFSIHQMVEIAARALSPGVNDPYTAIACIDNLTSTMCYLARAKFPPRYLFDDKGNLRLIADTSDFEGVLDAAFNQIRQFSAGSTAVIIRLMEALIAINEFTIRESHKKAVLKHAKMVLSVGKQTIKEQNDIEDLFKRSDRAFDVSNIDSYAGPKKEEEKGEEKAKELESEVDE